MSSSRALAPDLTVGADARRSLVCAWSLVRDRAGRHVRRRAPAFDELASTPTILRALVSWRSPPISKASSRTRPAEGPRCHALVDSELRVPSARLRNRRPAPRRRDLRREVARTILVLDCARASASGRQHRSVLCRADDRAARRLRARAAGLGAARVRAQSGHRRSARYVHYGWLWRCRRARSPGSASARRSAGRAASSPRASLTLVAASMLLFVSHFVARQARVAKVAQVPRAEDQELSRRRPWPLLMVAFVAAYREAIEIVLFFRALALDSPGARAPSRPASPSVGGAGRSSCS